MFSCDCCSPAKVYKSKKALYVHQRRHDPNYVDPHQRVIAAYEANPFLCECCGSAISYKKKTKGVNKFCSKTCAAKVNNVKFPKRTPATPKQLKEKRADRKPRNFTAVKIVDGKRVYEFGPCEVCGTPRKNGQSNTCSVSCYHKTEWEAFKNSSDSVWNSKRRKRQLLEENGNVCSRCNNSEWQGEPINLEIEHIDGNSENNDKQNVCLLCPNCHSMTPTYKSKNIGNGRAFRRKRYAEGKSY